VSNWIRNLLRWKVRVPDDETTVKVPQVTPHWSDAEELERRRAALKYEPQHGFLKDQVQRGAK